MPLSRTPNRGIREFHHFLLKRAREPFAWGINDCSLFAADAIQSFTGVDLASDFRGKYKDEASAFALIKTVTGGETVADAAAWCAKKHGLVERIHPLMAQRGDLVIVPDSGNLISAVVHLNGRHVVTVGEKGLLRLSIMEVKRAWAI